MVKRGSFKKWFSQFSLILFGLIAYMIIINFAVISAWVKSLLGHLAPFFAGAIIAYILDIPCSKFEKILLKRKSEFVRERSRGLSIIFTLSIGLLIVAFAVNMLIPQLTKSISEFVQNFPYYYEKIVNFILAIESGELAYLGLGDTIEFLLNSLLDSLARVDLKSAFSFDFILDSVRKVLTVSTIMFNTLIAIVTSVYLLFEKKKMRLFFRKIFDAFAPEKHSRVLLKYVKDTNSYLKKFLYCNIIDGTIVGTVSILIHTIVGVKYGVILGVLGGLTNMIPYFGALFGSIIVTVIVLITEGWSKALIIGILLMILQAIDGNIIMPKIYGGTFNISPVVVIVGVVLGGAYYGILGMIFAVPAAAIIRNIVNDILEYRIRRKKANKMKKTNDQLA